MNDLCECQLQYLVELEREEAATSSLLASPAADWPVQATLKTGCAPLCEKAKRLAMPLLQAETLVAHRLRDSEVDPQHFQLLCERLALILSFASPTSSESRKKVE
jgi:hypothetical protein